MDSLFASYASDDDDAEEREILSKQMEKPPIVQNKKPTNLKSGSASSVTETSLFGSIPAPQSSFKESSTKSGKRLVTFQLPVPNSVTLDGDDDDFPRKKAKPDTAESKGKVGLSAFLPAPKYSRTLGEGSSQGSRKLALPSSAEGNHDAAVIQESKRDSPTPPPTEAIQREETREDMNSAAVHALAPSSEYYIPEDSQVPMGGQDLQQQGYVDPAFYAEQQFGAGSSNHATWQQPEESVDPLEQVLAMERKKGGKLRNVEIKEVRQQDLTKGAKRQQQLSLTGLAFGPAYQGSGDSKDKPSKLHRRKHQIGSLYSDMKKNEGELAERRSRGLLTKAETHAKYGW